jgi:hypothetical protein
MAGRRTAAATNINNASGPEIAMGRGRRPIRTPVITTSFNPKLIFSQIVAIQCFHYLILALLFQINHVMFATSVTIDRIFTDEYLTMITRKGWIDNSAILLSYLFG